MGIFDPSLFDPAVFDTGEAPSVIWPGAINVVARYDWQTPSVSIALDPVRAAAAWGAAKVTYAWGPE